MFRILKRIPLRLVICSLPNTHTPNWNLIRYVSKVAPELKVPDWDRGGKTKENSLTPLYSMCKKYIDAHPGVVCLIQVGSFYELYFEQAEVYGTKLGLKVATRKTSNYDIPMSGFPLIQLQKYVKLLVQDLHTSVAIIDQFPGLHDIGDRMIHRKVSRIITPGTLVDETFMNYNENNYLLAISLPTNCTKQPHDPDMPIGVSWIDVSVGDFYVQQTTLSELLSDITRVNPSEIILSKEFMSEDLENWYEGFNELKKYFLRYHKVVYSDLKLLFKSNLNNVRKLIETFTVREEAAMNMILSYINVNLPERNPSFDLPSRYWSGKYLQMDARTRDSLDLIERSGGISGKNLTTGSLINTIKRTVTPSGTRMLTEWIKSPILDEEEIKHRQNFSQLFTDEVAFSHAVEDKLKQLDDFVRSAQRLALGTGDTITNLNSVARGLNIAFELKKYIENNKKGNYESLLNRFLEDLVVPIEIAKKIDDTFDQIPVIKVEELEPNDTDGPENSLVNQIAGEDPNVQTTFVIKKTYNSKLANLHKELDKLRHKEMALFNSIKGKVHEIDKKLSIQIKQQHGKFYDVIYINGKSKLIEEIDQQFQEVVRSKRKNMILIKPHEWKHLQHEINANIDRISNLENKIIEELRETTVEKVVEIRRLSKLLDFLDVTLSFSKLTQEYKLCRPQFLKSNNLIIEEGRHIVVESSLKAVGSNFVENNTKLTNDLNIWVITGPNMGGKSTFLRQNAIIVIMAQIGCYVPASSCKLGLVDKIFTRIGASDDLFNDLSTFMVEMIEVSNILKNATKRSLAVVDEVGRGTSGKEGLAIAYSTLVSLMKFNRCRALFATHFGHEIKEILEHEGDPKDKIGFYKTGVLEEVKKGKVHMTIHHKLEKGISEKSYAIEVAQLAGFPKKSLDIANKALTHLS